MLTFRRILFPVDFSGSSNHMAPYVAGIARRFHSHVSLLHMLDVAAMGRPVPLDGSGLQTAYEEAVWKQRESELASFAHSTFDGLDVTRSLELGDSADGVARYIERNGIDLVVMPTHGLGKFRWLLLGSVTAKILHDAQCPVWTMVHCETPPPYDADKIRSIVCGIDPFSESAAMIETASGMAAEFGATVRLVHAISAPDARTGRSFNADFKRFLFDNAQEWTARIQAQMHTAWEVSIQGGAVSSVIREAAIHYQADLVIIGRGSLPNRLGRFRTHVGAIIRDSPCPVLSV
ncbi:MAG TPA: universal stress protein [Nitrospira sp.]|jgi:nucleotide-binding universal stress UspA family protein|nr:universal stress protein [Nitrospira sp.]